jgi:nitroreductase
VTAPADAQRDALDRRKSVRGFRPEPLPRATLEAVFAAAQRAPSWCNIQPWRVWVTEPPTTARLTAALTAPATTAPPAPDGPFPAEYPAPYHAPRRTCGGALYGAMGIGREDRA